MLVRPASGRWLAACREKRLTAGSFVLIMTKSVSSMRWGAMREEVLRPRGDDESSDELQPLTPGEAAPVRPPAGAAVRIADLLDGTALFVLAKEWVDLLSIYAFKIHPSPFCVAPGGEDEEYTAHELCTSEASSPQQAVFTLGLLLSAAVLKQIAVRCRPEGHRVPTMLGMAVGWAAGSACVTALRETTSSCLLDVALAAIVTVLCGVLIAVLQPWTFSFDFADDGALAYAEALLQDVWQLCSKALSIMVMIVWTHVLTRALNDGVLDAQLGGRLHQKLLLLWAVALTTFLSALTVSAAKVRVALQRQQQLQERESSHAVELSFLRRIEWRVNQRAAAIQLLNLGEAAFGWVSGCAWTDAVSSPPPPPRPRVPADHPCYHPSAGREPLILHVRGSGTF